MSSGRAAGFLGKQAADVWAEGLPGLVRKLRMGAVAAWQFAVGFPIVVAMRLARPWYLIRICEMRSERIGHFAANTELYLCERDARVNHPGKPHLDLFHFQERVCNRQLAEMWKRVLPIGPRAILGAARRVNRWLPGYEAHEVGLNRAQDRDVLNLLERFPPHLRLTPDEERRGAEILRSQGIAPDDPIVCLNVRDSAYLGAHLPGSWDYHSYRDSRIEDYELAAAELADRGYWVLRMGAVVGAPMRQVRPRVLDYATNGMRSEFLDIYLGWRCTFCVTTGAGWDNVPRTLFRKPAVYVNFLPIGHAPVSGSQHLFITKRVLVEADGTRLSVGEAFHRGAAGFAKAEQYRDAGLAIEDNRPEEIRDAVLEMDDRLHGRWVAGPDDERLQARFWAEFAKGQSAGSVDFHGDIRARHAAAYLRENPDLVK